MLAALVVLSLLATCSASRELHQSSNRYKHNSRGAEQDQAGLYHADIMPLPESADNITMKFEPYILINDACYPHTAVAANGDYSRGQSVRCCTSIASDITT